MAHTELLLEVIQSVLRLGGLHVDRVNRVVDVLIEMVALARPAIRDPRTTQRRQLP